MTAPTRHPPGNRLDPLKTLFDIIQSAVTVTGALVAAWWAVTEYWDREQQERVKTTLDYRQQYNKEPVLSAKTKVDAAWLATEGEAEELLRARNHEGWENLVFKVIESNRLAAQIETIAGFYDDLYVCIQRKLCDRPTALDMFGRDAEAFADLHYRYFLVKRQERQDEKVAYGVDQIAMEVKKLRGQLKEKVGSPVSPTP